MEKNYVQIYKSVFCKYNNNRLLLKCLRESKDCKKLVILNVTLAGLGVGSDSYVINTPLVV